MKEYKEKVRETFTFQLTEPELLKRGEEAGELSRVIADKEYKFACIKKEKKAEIDAIKADLNHVLKIVHAKAEERQVDCFKIYDFVSKKVSFVFKGEILSERPMNEYETQMQFDTKLIQQQAEAAQ